MNNTLKITIIYAIIAIIFAYTYMAMHEQVHVSILRSYGIDTKVHVGEFGASTTPTNQTDYDLKCTVECHQSNNLTDVVGYHLIVLIFCLWGLFYIREIINIKQIETMNYG